MPLQQSLNVVQAANPSRQLAPPPAPLVVVVPPVPVLFVLVLVVPVLVDVPQTPFVHDPLQHSLPAEQGLPSAGQAVLVFPHAAASTMARRGKDSSDQTE